MGRPRHEGSPPDPLTASAVELAAAIASGALTSRLVVDAHIAAIERVNPVLNAVVATRFPEARAEADAADAKVAAGEALPPFHGVPFTVKECFALRGMPQSSGLVARKQVRADGDATAVVRLRAAGAIPLGVTNVSELCMWLETHNKVYGRTNNPYATDRMVGGSSGGEGAIVGSGASPFGLGADVGGSIRMPAYFNGVFGHKPSAGYVANSGQYPLAAGRGLRYLTTGPIARRAADLWPLLQVLRGPDGLDGGCEEFGPHHPDDVDIASLRVLVVPDDGRVRVSPRVADAQRRAAEALAARGATVREARIPQLRRAVEIWSAMLDAAGNPKFDVLLGDGRPVALAQQTMKLLLGRSPHTIPALGLAALERLSGLTARQFAAFREQGVALRRALDAEIGDGVMLYPPFWRTAPRHDRALLRPLRFGYTAILNVMELPATQVPCGLSARGLPTGVQVVAGHGGDHKTIAVARVLEQALGGWIPPRGLGSAIGS